MKEREEYFVFSKENNEYNYEYLLHDLRGEIFFAKKGDELLTLPKYENIKEKLNKLCETLIEEEIYNFDKIKEL